MAVLRKHGPQGELRHDWPEFSTSTWEIQVKYATGWETIEVVDPHLVEIVWRMARQRWSTLQLRLVRDGREVR